MIAYLLKAIVILIPIIMMILMVCGCLYIYERFTKEDEKVNKYTDYTQIETQATMLLLLLQQRIMSQGFVLSWMQGMEEVTEVLKAARQ